jgi:transcriptional regulator with XRE-family HTH domain
MKVNLAETIRKLRKAENLTQEEVAAALGVTLQAVSRWETGASLPDVELLPSIAAFFGVTLDALFGVDPESEEAKLGKFYDEVDEIEPDDEQIALIKRYMAELPGCPYLRLRLMEAYEERGREYASARLDEMRKLCRFIIERTECGDWQRDLALRIMIEVEDDNLTGEGYAALEKSAELCELYATLPENFTLRFNSPVLAESSRTGTHADVRRDIEGRYSCTVRGSGWEWFDRGRGEKRFNACVGRLRALCGAE